jgi:hypothetical protein
MNVNIKKIFSEDMRSIFFAGAKGFFLPLRREGMKVHEEEIATAQGTFR